MNIDERKKDMGETRKTLAKEFNDCRPILSVLGDTTRQSIILCLLENMKTGGMRVGELVDEIHISIEEVQQDNCEACEERYCEGVIHHDL